MKLKLSNVSSKYGAPMGRKNYLPDDHSTRIKLRLERLKFIDGCYDQGGAYWGAPATVWCGWNEDYQLFVRSNTRAEAKTKLKNILTNACFYR